MAELGRLVMRSRAQGLRTRLAAAFIAGADRQGHRRLFPGADRPGDRRGQQGQGHGAGVVHRLPGAGHRLGGAGLHFQRHASRPRRHLHPGLPAGSGALGRGDLRPRADPVAELPPGQTDRRRRPRHRPRRPLHRHPAAERGLQPRPVALRTGDGLLPYDQPLLRPARPGGGADRRPLHRHHHQHLQLASHPSPGDERGRQPGLGSRRRRPDELRDHQGLRLRGSGRRALRGRHGRLRPRRGEVEHLSADAERNPVAGAEPRPLSGGVPGRGGSWCTTP